jgi:hypothetical protein
MATKLLSETKSWSDRSLRVNQELLEGPPCDVIEVDHGWKANNEYITDACSCLLVCFWMRVFGAVRLLLLLG